MTTRISGALAVVCVLVAGRAQAEQQAAAQIDPAAVPPVAGAFPQQTPGVAPLTSAQALPAGRTARNSIYLELAGNGLLYTINYDRVINENFSVRAGLGYLSVSASASSGGQTASAKVSLMGIPVLANFMLGGDNHKIELGAGMTLFYASGSASSADAVASGSGMAPVGTAVLGYRYVPHDGGFTFRAGFTPLVSKQGFQPWAGMSFGYVF